MRKKCIVSIMSLLLAVGCAVGFAACDKDAPGGTDEPDEPHVHTEVADEAVAPTCTKNGLTEGSHCAVCGEVIVAQRTVPALGHELSYHAGQAATCTQAGWNAYETCGNCSYTTYAEIPALDHNYVDGVCTRCGASDPDAQPTPGGTDEPDEPHVHTEVADEAVAPTCTKNGLTEGSHCAVCGEVIVAQRTVPALGHELSYHAGQAATCTQAGWNAYETCGNCGYTTYAEIPALDHNYVGGVCTRCGVADPDAQPTPGGTDEPDEPHVHTEVTDEAVAPTCTKNGLTEGSHCAVCGEVIVAQRTVPALGHELSYHAGQAATCTQAGWNAYETCGNCGYTTYAEIPALDHNYVDGVCTRCGASDPDAQPTPGGTESLLEFTFNGTSYALTGIGAHSDPHVVIPSEFHGYPVTEIGGRAFADRHWITEVTIPDSVTSIEYEAFENCSSLTSIVIPDSVTSIGDGAFDNTAYYNDENNRENGVLYIGKYLIDAKTTISGNHEIREGTLIIADGAFSDCSSLTSIVIPDSVTSIGVFAFRDCSSLTGITIPDSVTSIENSAFYGCSSLTSIVIPDSVTSIGGYAFYGCSSLTSIAIPDSVTSIESDAFYGCSSLTGITIPDSVTIIGDYAFYGCSSLTSIAIPDSVTSIGVFAFRGCSSLTGITIPDSVTSIENSAFYGCSSLTSIAIPDSVTSIGSQAFYYCSSLTSIAIPDSVTSIGGSAFYYCSSLTSILVAEGNKVYHSAGNCLIETASKTLILGCSTSVIPVDGSVTSIGDGAFYGCSSLTSIAIPDSVTSIGGYAFHGCSSLTSILVAEGNKVYHSAGNCLIETASKTLILGCSTSVIPVDGSVTSIESYAFYGCSSLTSIAIPDSVTSIGRRAFHGCDSLTTVYYTGTEEEWAAIEIGILNNVLDRADIICNYTGE